MENLLEIIQSPVWWITVVVAGIIINVLSSYLRDIIDKRASKASKWWRDRSEKAKRQDQEYVLRLKADENFRSLHFIRYTHVRTWSIIWTLLGMISFLSALIISDLYPYLGISLLAIGSISLFRSFQLLVKSNKYIFYAEEALDPKDT